MAPVVAALTDGRVVWDLLPDRARQGDDVAGGRRAVRPSGSRSGSSIGAGQTVNHWNKLLKGALVRWLLTERPGRPGGPGHFDHPLGYRFDPDASDLTGPVATAVLRER